MSVTIAEEPHLLRTVPGRARIHVPDLTDRDPGAVASRLRGVPGVRSVQPNTLTSNILVRFDPRVTTERALLAAARPQDRARPHQARAHRRAWPRPRPR